MRQHILGHALLAIVFLAGALAAGQNNPTEHTFQASQAELDKALQNLRASTPGRLPTLDGFVSPDVPMLEKYQRGYYQYKLEERPAGTEATLLRGSVKVTAWYAGEGATQAGYRELPSNGRLETDLIERLEEALQRSSASAAPASSDPPMKSRPAVTEPPPAKSARNSPSDSSPFRTFPTDQPANRASLAPPDTHELAQQRRVQQLTEQATNLEEILRSQAHPNDLAAVLKTGTPVYAKPLANSDVLFRADAEDEFKVLDESQGWVHVQVSGISRGWIRRPELEMPGETAAVGDTAAKPATALPGPATHEDTSLFPGDWSHLRGRMVRIIWIRPDLAAGQNGADRWQLARSIFRDGYSEISKSEAKIEGVVIVIDAADGGMIAATANSLRLWNTGAISDAAFRKECWADPPEALGNGSGEVGQ